MMDLKHAGLIWVVLGGVSGVFAQEEKPVVYEVDWKMGEVPGAEWKTSGKVMASPNEKRTFLGGMTDEEVTSLSLKDLPEHKVLTVEVELFLVGTWDGSHKTWGPDKMKIALNEQFILLDTSFSNCMANDWTGKQHYPEDLTGAGNYNCFTGISFIGELGYRQQWARYEPVQNVPIDSTYKLKFSVPHNTKALTLSFQSDSTEQDGSPDDQTEQWYGIGKVSVSTFDEEAVDEAEWAKLRSNLFNPFIPISNHAFWEMMRYPTRFRADFDLLKMSSNQEKWWYPRAERLLSIKAEAPVNKD